MPWIILGIYAFVSYKPDLIIWPGENIVSIYSDSNTTDKGNSGIRKLPSPKDQLSFEYKLGGHYIYPYIGVSFNKKDEKQFFDLSQYDFVEIELNAEKSRHIPFVLNENIREYSKPDEGLSFRPWTKEIVFEEGVGEYTIPLNDFDVPSWWFSLRNLTEKDLSKKDLSRIQNIQFHNCQLLGKDTLEKFSVYSIRFYKDMSLTWIIGIAFIITYYLVWYVYNYVSRPGKKIFPRTEIVMSNLVDENTKKVMDFIGEKYSHTDLSLEDIQKELGMTEAKISGIIKDSSQMGFKKYLNHIRLEEAKRLLLNSDRQVMEIAFKVGYGNISHFNRVFKDEIGVSPNEYRKNALQKP